MLHAVIMAGGSGTRFWPASRKVKPKQLLTLSGTATMIQATVARLGDLIPASQISVITNQRLVEAISEQLPQLPTSAIVGEPCKRDTAPCIGLAAHLVSRDDSDATMVVMPADHVISPEDKFQETLLYAASLVEQSPDRIVTLGINPTYAAETYGYIERGTELSTNNPLASAYEVSRFREKPKGQTAVEYFESGNFYWNSGIFLWKAKTVLEALALHAPQMSEHLERISAAWGTSQQAAVLEQEFAAIEGISIDYAVMEHHKNVAVIEAPFTWDDVGNWQSLSRLNEQDDQGNTVLGKHLNIDSTNCIIRAEEDHLVVTVGLQEIIIVNTSDATLVADRNQEEAIREVVKKLADLSWEEYL